MAMTRLVPRSPCIRNAACRWIAVRIVVFIGQNLLDVPLKAVVGIVLPAGSLRLAVGE